MTIEAERLTFGSMPGKPWNDLLQPAIVELTDSEIVARYGGLMSEAMAAFNDDPSYLVDMAENAATVAYKRHLWEAKAEAQRLAADPEAVKILTLQLMSERGVSAPRKTGARRRRGSDAA